MGQAEPVENLSRLEAFYAQAPGIAVDRRLLVLQRNMRDYQFLTQDLGTLWQAVEQCYRTKGWQQLTAFREALQPFLDVQGFWNHSLTLNKWACEAAQALGDDVRRARYIHDLANILNQQGSYRQAEQLYLQSEKIYLRQELHEWALKSRHMRSMVVRAQGKAGEAQHLCQSTVVEARQLGLDQWLAHPLFVLAIFARDRGDTHQAESLITECLVRLDGTGEDDLVAQCHNFLAEIALRQKKLAQARAHLDVSLPLLQHRGVKRLEMATRRLLGELAAAEDRSEEAERIYAQGLSMFDTDQLNDTMGQAQMLFSRARLLVQLHRAQDAVRVLEASLALFTRLSHPRGILGVSWWLFKLYVRQCHWLRALCLIPPVLRTARAANLLTPRQLLAVLHRRPL